MPTALEGPQHLEAEMPGPSPPAIEDRMMDVYPAPGSAHVAQFFCKGE